MNKKKLEDIMILLKSATKFFVQELEPRMKPIFKKMIKNIIPILTQNLDHPGLNRQMVFFIHGNVSTLDIEIVPILEEFTFTVCQA
jgi:hypothetical protein